MNRVLIQFAVLTLGMLTSQAAFAEPAKENGFKSEKADVAVTVEFVNKSGRTVEVHWLDYEGHRKHYKTLKNGESYEQPTYVTHPWVITDEDGEALQIYLPDPDTRTVEIPNPKELKPEK